MKFRSNKAILLATMVALAACTSACGGDDEPAGGSGGSGGTAGTGGTGGAGGAGTCGGADTTGCEVVVEAGADDATTLQTALIEVKSGGSVCLCPGNYSITKEVSLNVPGVTVKGLGTNIEDTLLDFKAQTEGDDAFTVTSDGFTAENFALKNSPGNGIVVTGAEDVTFRKLKVSWDAGSVTTNGAYAVYPVKSKRVIVEDSEVIGAADAGVYVGQCEQVIVRRNKVHGNVLGIEIENTLDAEVYENEAFDNTTGIAVFLLPNLEQKVGNRALVRDNKVYGNNRANFGEKGTIVASSPAGTGVFVLSFDQAEIRNNEIKDNDSTGVLVVSMKTVEILLATQPDPQTDVYPQGTYVHGNTFTNNGSNPQDLLGAFNIKPLETIVWDGQVDPAVTGDALCLGDPPLPSFRNINAAGGGITSNDKHTTDATPHQCKLPELPPLSW